MRKPKPRRTHSLPAHRTVYNEYAKLKDLKKLEAYYAKHGTEIEVFKDAREYLNAVMNGRTDPPPIKDWQAEQKKLTAAKYAACERYYALQDEVRSMEQLLSCVRTYRNSNRAVRRTWCCKRQGGGIVFYLCRRLFCALESKGSEDNAY